MCCSVKYLCCCLVVCVCLLCGSACVYSCLVFCEFRLGHCDCHVVGVVASRCVRVSYVFVCMCVCVL